jgi:hypothetical protein
MKKLQNKGGWTTAPNFNPVLIFVAVQHGWKYRVMAIQCKGLGRRPAALETKL